MDKLDLGGIFFGFGLVLTLYFIYAEPELFLIDLHPIPNWFSLFPISMILGICLILEWVDEKKKSEKNEGNTNKMS